MNRRKPLKAMSVLRLHYSERCSVAEIAIGLRMRVEHVARIVRHGWWPLRRRA